MIKKRENEYVSYDGVLCLNSSFMYVESKLFGFYLKTLRNKKALELLFKLQREPKWFHQLKQGFFKILSTSTSRGHI